MYICIHMYLSLYLSLYIYIYVYTHSMSTIAWPPRRSSGCPSSIKIINILMIILIILTIILSTLINDYDI